MGGGTDERPIASVGVVGVMSSKYLIRAKTESRLPVYNDSYLYISL